jgi:putative ABC transport system permease protein
MLALLRYAIGSVMARRLTAIATITGIASLVFTLAGSLMLLDGIDRALRDQGSPSVGVVLSTGATSELASMIENSQIATVLDVAGAGRVEDHVVETVTVMSVPRKDGKLANVLTRGIGEKGMTFRRGFKLVAGRAPAAGTTEAIVGVKLRGLLKGFEVGSNVRLNKKLELKIVGFFSDGGSAYESEIWADRAEVGRAFGKEGFASSLRIRARSPDQLRDIRSALDQDKRIHLQLQSERDYFESQGSLVAPLIIGLGIGMSFFIGLGSSMGLAMTMFGAVAQRTREIGVLRAIGFRRMQILVVFLGEALTYGVVGGVLGSLAALVLATVDFSVRGLGWSEVTFNFAAGPKPMLIGVASAMVVALISGLFPAIRASRVSAIAAMRNAA